MIFWSVYLHAIVSYGQLISVVYMIVVWGYISSGWHPMGRRLLAIVRRCGWDNVLGVCTDSPGWRSVGGFDVVVDGEPA